MNKIRAYIETTIFNRYFEVGREFHSATVALFDRIAAGTVEAYTSNAVLGELGIAPSPKREDMLELVLKHNMTVFKATPEVDALAESYLEAGIIPRRFKTDALHIATAVTNGMDCIISLNFHHINKLKTKHMTETINRMRGLGSLDICTPEEVDYE